jgi:hypothetical protein
VGWIDDTEEPQQLIPGLLSVIIKRSGREDLPFAGTIPPLLDLNGSPKANTVSRCDHHWELYKADDHGLSPANGSNAKRFPRLAAFGRH